MLSLQKVKFPSPGWPVQPLAFVGENALNRILAALMPPPGMVTKFGSSVPTSFPSYLLKVHDPSERVLHKEERRLDQGQDFLPMMVASLSLYWSRLVPWVLVSGKRGI